MAASAIGGWVAAACINKLVDQVCSYAGDQYEYQRKDTKDKLRSLKKSLLTIQAVVHKSERLQNKNTNMERWLRSIKDAAHQAEDVLDLFDYRVLEAQAEDIGKVTTNSFASATTASCSSTTTTSTITSITTSSGSTVKQSVCVLKRLLFSDKDLNELSAVVKVFDEIDSQMQTFLELVKLEDRKPEQPLQWRTTTSMPGTGKFYGRVNEEAHLKKLLMQTNEQYNLPYAVISVVGIGGVGKTALVQRVYSHFRAASHFNFAVWLHVSDKFDVERLTREMVQSDNLSIPADLNGITNLDQVQWKLQDKLNGNRILVVLDDVWNELSSQWENLCKPLKKLSLCWNHLEKGTTNTDHEGVFEGLQPNPNLGELHVNSYMGIKSPPWLCKEYLSNIHSIELVSCHQWKTLPPFGSLPFLRILKIRHLKAVENIDAGFYGDAAVVFPSLEELIFEGMTQWKRWSCVDSSQHIFPRLRDIRIKRCKQLMGPLPLPVSLNRIKISVSNWLSENIVSSKSKKTANVNTSFSVQLSLDRIGLLIGCLQTSSLATIQMLDISSYHLVAFNKDQEEWLQQLTSVKELRFTDCPQLTSLPSNIIHLTSLEYLYVEKCPKLESFPHMGFPPSLKKLSVIKCHNNLSQICSRTNISNNNMIQQDIERESKLCNAKKRKRTSS